MTSLRAGRGKSLGPVRPPWHNIPAEVRTRSAGEGEPLEGDETYPAPDYPVEPFDVVPDMEPAAQEPVEVVVVGNVPAPLTDWSSQSYSVGTAPIMVAGRNKNRTRMILHNSGDILLETTNCRIMRTATDIPAMAYQLSHGESLELLHNEQVWVVCMAGHATTVNVMTEFVVESGE